MKGAAKNQELEKLLADEFGVTDFPADAPAIVDRSRHLQLAERLK